MAKNFRISSREKDNHTVRILLQGDFDGTSAHELINLLKKYGADDQKVAIDTQGLKNIHPYGVDVLVVRLKSLRRARAGIVFTGRFKSRFTQD